MADVASKPQTTALCLSTIVTRTRRHTELTKKLTNLMGNLCSAREHSVQFFVLFFTQLNALFNLKCMGPLRHILSEWNQLPPSLLTYVTHIYASISAALNKLSIYLLIAFDRQKSFC